MMNDEIVTYEVAKLAKDKGFPQHIGDDAYIVENEYDDKYEVGCHYPIQFTPDYLPTITAPTQSLLQRWLREEKGIHIGIGTDGGNDWCYITVVITTGHTEYNTNIFPTYELALEDALKYALEKLV